MEILIFCAVVPSSLIYLTNFIKPYTIMIKLMLLQDTHYL